MRRFILAALVCCVGALAPAEEKARKTTTITVTGKDCPHQWVVSGAFPKDKSTKDFVTGTKIGSADKRLQIPVSKGDIVAFLVAEGSHRALFENAKTEQAAGVWEIVTGSGELVKLPDGKLPEFDHADAMNSKANSGDLIKIRILKLEKGKSILFACNPHSNTKTDVVMVGAIVPK